MKTPRGLADKYSTVAAGTRSIARRYQVRVATHIGGGPPSIKPLGVDRGRPKRRFSQHLSTGIKSSDHEQPETQRKRDTPPV